MDDHKQSHSFKRPIRLTRRANLQLLLVEFGGPGALAEKTGTSDTHLSAIQTGSRELGDELATKLEVGAGKPLGWMDVRHGERSEVIAADADHDVSAARG